MMNLYSLGAPLSFGDSIHATTMFNGHHHRVVGLQNLIDALNAPADGTVHHHVHTDRHAAHVAKEEAKHAGHHHHGAAAQDPHLMNLCFLNPSPCAPSPRLKQQNKHKLILL